MTDPAPPGAPGSDAPGPDAPGPDAFGPDVVADEAPVAAGRPSAAAMAAWVVLALAGVALDGPFGGAVAVVVAAVVLARLPLRVIGGLGVAALALAPFTVLVSGLPADADISPRFVADAMAAHHLTFAGLVLVGTWAVLDMWPAMRATARAAHEVAPDPLDARARPPLVVGIVVVAVVAAAAVVACAAVLGG